MKTERKTLEIQFLFERFLNYVWSENYFLQTFPLSSNFKFSFVHPYTSYGTCCEKFFGDQFLYEYCFDLQRGIRSKL